MPTSPSGSSGALIVLVRPVLQMEVADQREHIWIGLQDVFTLSAHTDRFGDKRKIKPGSGSLQHLSDRLGNSARASRTA